MGESDFNGVVFISKDFYRKNWQIFTKLGKAINGLNGSLACTCKIHKANDDEKVAVYFTGYTGYGLSSSLKDFESEYAKHELAKKLLMANERILFSFNDYDKLFDINSALDGEIIPKDDSTLQVVFTEKHDK